jgi:hypothetical protein
MPRALAFVPFAGVLAACAATYDLPPDAKVTCSVDADCPGKLLCRASTGKCVEPSTNEPPAVALGTIQRSAATVSIPITAVDPEGDACALAVSVDLGEGFVPITVSPSSIPASGGGVSSTVSWDPATVVPAPSTLYRAGLRVRVVPSDSHGSGAAVTSDPFAIGNDPPVLDAVTVDDAVVTGLTVVRFRALDSAADSVSVASVELGFGSTFADVVTIPIDPGPSGHLPSGELTGVSTAATAAAATEHSFTWRSSMAAPIDRADARLRLTVRDALGALSSPVTTAPFTLNNANSPPTLTVTASPLAGSVVTTSVVIGYTLADADGDLCGVEVDYSIDGGSTWTAAASASATSGLAPGLQAFSWEVGSLPSGLYPLTQLRLRANDGRAWSQPALTPTFAVDTRVNLPPLVTLLAVAGDTGGRPLAAMSLDLVLADPEGEDVTLLVEFSVDGGASWRPATLASAPPAYSAPSVGAPHTLTWDLLADAARPGAAPLAPVTLVTAADGSTTFAAVAGVDGVKVRITPVDAQGAHGSPAASLPFLLGDQAPAASVAGPSSEVAADVPVQVSLADAQSDLADLVLEFRTGPAAPWTRASIALGTMTSLATTAAGRSYVVVWASAAAGNPDVTVPQGIGPRLLSTVQLRVRAIDQVGSVRAFGPWSDPTPAFTVRNQTPPRIAPVFIKSDGALHNGLVPITYLLLDDEGDPADVLFEFSVDEGLTWSPCSEATIPSSEGLEALSASPAGVPHTWVWDSSANIALFAQSVRLRATAAGALSGPGPATPLMQQRPVGLAAGVGREVLFANPVKQVTGVSSPELAVSDLDGDGVPDLAIVTLSGQLVVRRGLTSAGKWTGAYASPGLSYPLFADGGAVAAGDVTCDGIPDLVVATNGNYFSHGGTPDVLQVFAGVGDGTFTPYGTSITTSLASEDVHVVDMDGDGHLDIVVTARFGPALVLFSDGNTPSCSVADNAVLGGGGGRTVGIGDLDADGLQDVVFGNGKVFYGAPLASGSRFVAGTNVPGLQGGIVALADVDGDGDADVVAPGFAARSDGHRGFDATSVFPSGAGPNDLGLTDLNGDGLLDLLVVNFNGGDVSVLMAADRGGVWEGGFVDAFSIKLAIGQQSSALALVDLDGDGRADLVVGDRNSGVETLLGTSTSPFGAASLKSPEVFATKQFESANAFAADFDLDGVPDLMVSGFGATLVTGSRDGLAASGLLQAGEQWTFADDVALPAAGDFDGDGYFDLVVAHPTISFSFTPATKASFFRGRPRTGGPTFVTGTAPSFSDAVEWARCTEALFIDGDAWLDLLVVTSAGPSTTVRAFFGSASGFAAGPVTTIGAGVGTPSRCLVADFDADGRLDLMLPTGAIWRVAADGTLTAFGGGTPSGILALADYDLDGIIDVFVARSTPDRVEVYHGAGTSGVGTGSFTLAGSITGFSSYIQDVKVVDVDGDGVPDVIATTANRTVAVAIGNGPQGVGDATYRAPVEAASPSAMIYATLFDGNGDWVPDVAALDPALSKPKALTVVSAMRTAVTPSWRTRVGAGAGSRLLGTDTAPAESNLLGLRLGGSFTRMPFSTAEVGPIDRNRGSGMTSAMFLQLLRGAQVPAVPAQLVPLTLAWTWSGARSLVRGPGPDGAARLEIRERFGPRLAPGSPQRTGLSLSGPGPQRGVIIDLPILPGRASVDGKVRVYARAVDYTRASDFAGDPLVGSPAGAGWLPVEGGQPVIHPTFAWREAVQTASLGTGTGPRFVIDRSRNLVRVALDEDATLQAFSVP